MCTSQHWYSYLLSWTFFCRFLMWLDSVTYVLTCTYMYIFFFKVKLLFQCSLAGFHRSMRNVDTYALENKDLSDWTEVLQSIVRVSYINSACLVTDGHVCFAHIVNMAQVCLLAPLQECQTMKPFHRVGGQTDMV